MRPLFERFPALAQHLPCARLADLPTALTRMSQLERAGAAALYVKHDELSARDYGGNKVRKLEFLLAGARAAGAREVLTFGAAGSNHALATAIHARSLGLGCLCMLIAQPPHPQVRDNLLAAWRAGAQLHHYADEAGVQAALPELLQRRETALGVRPYLIPGGGSAALGSVGFVNAALELHAQLCSGARPAPTRLYVALGTTGTAAGLRLGLDLAGLATRVVAVRVVHESIGSLGRLSRLYAETNALLHALDASVPELELDPDSVELRHEFFGGGYALHTPAALAAVARAREHAGLTLEGTYTGKAFAALLSDLDAGRLDGPALFWNSYHGRPLAAPLAGTDYRALPRDFHCYFQGEP